MPSELPAIWAVRKRMQRWFVLPNFAGYSQVLRLFPPFVPFALQFAAEIAEFEHVHTPSGVIPSEQAVCFWGAHGCLGITLFGRISHSSG